MNHAATPASMNLASLKVACGNCSLRELCLPMGLDKNDLDRLDKIINRRQRVQSGQHLYRARDAFHYLYSIRRGFFKTYELNNDGIEHVNGFHMAGEMIGLDAISDEAHACNAVALEDSEVCEVPFLKLEELFRDIPTLQHQFHRVMSREIGANHGLMMLLGTMRAEEKLATFLTDLAERLAARGLSSASMRLSMSREDIGNYLGLKLETVSRMFSKFQDEGLIAVERRNLHIKDMGGLRKIAQCLHGGALAGALPRSIR